MEECLHSDTPVCFLPAYLIRRLFIQISPCLILERALFNHLKSILLAYVRKKEGASRLRGRDTCSEDPEEIQL